MFCLFQGKEEDLKKIIKCMFGTVSTTLLGGHFYYKTGQK